MYTRLLMILMILLIALNLISFAAYGMDKHKAKTNQWRIPERVLLLLAFLGSLGALLGMKVFRHKTQKKKFTVTVPLFFLLKMILICGVIYLILTRAVYPAGNVDEALSTTDTVTVSEIEEGYFFDGPGEEVAYIFYPGALVETEAYAPLMKTLAEGGVDCFLMDMPLHLALFNMDAAESILESDEYHYTSYYFGGHSMGGAAAAMYAETYLAETGISEGETENTADENKSGGSLAGLILLASYSTKDYTGTGLSALVIYGDCDEVVNMEKIQAGREYFDANLYTEVVISGGNHAGFGNYGNQAGDGTATISGEEQIRETAEAIFSHCVNN